MSDIWVGLTEVSKGEGCELEFSGVAAFVWWATQADSEETFVRKLEGVLKYYRLILIETTRIRRFEDTDDDLSDDFVEMVEQARQNESWVVFGTFYSFPHHTA